MPNRTSRGLLVAIATVLMLLGVATSSAQASPSHHGTDPYYSGCAQNSFPYTSRGIETEYGQVVAQATVWYSRSCGTNWVVVSSNPAAGNAIKRIWVHGGSELPPEVDYGPGWSYTMQVYAPGDICIHFQVNLKYPNGQHYAETYNAGATHQTVC